MDNRIEILEALYNLRTDLEKDILSCEKGIKEAPEGRLRISCRGKSIQYYLLNEDNKPHGQYLKKGNEETAALLAQKNYNTRVLQLTNQMLEQVDALDVQQFFVKLDAIYTGMSRERRKLIVPVRLPDREYVALWKAQEYKRKPFNADDETDFYTDKGERVRSKSEILIANTLNKMKVPYRYEYPLRLRNGKIVHPDFLVLNIRKREEYYWEHAGGIDKHDYREDFLRKVRDYMDIGLFPGDKMIVTAETANQPLKMWVIEAMIKKYCK